MCFGEMLIEDPLARRRSESTFRRTDCSRILWKVGLAKQIKIEVPFFFSSVPRTRFVKLLI